MTYSIFVPIGRDRVATRYISSSLIPYFYAIFFYRCEVEITNSTYDLIYCFYQRIFTKEFGRGGRQQRARGKTKENAGTLPLALSMIRRNGRQPTTIDIIEEFQCLEEQTEGTEPVRSFTVAYFKGDVVALKHNYKRYLEPFFLAVLLEDIHMDRNRFAEENLIMQWLEQSEEDPLVYEFGNQDGLSRSGRRTTRFQL